MMDPIIQNELDDAIAAITQLKETKNRAFIEKLAQILAEAFKKGRKVIIAGNGGSLCDANHFAEELTGYFRGKRPALPAISLSEAGHMSCVGNDAGFEYVFSRGVEAYGKPGDVFVALTTSGNSPNLVEALKTAREKSLYTVGFLGKSGGKALELCDLACVIEGFKTSDRIQEAHMSAIHITIQLVEHLLYNND